MDWIDEKELLKATGYKHRGWLRRALDRQGIRYFVGRNGRIVVPRSSMDKLSSAESNKSIRFT